RLCGISRQTNPDGIAADCITKIRRHLMSESITILYVEDSPANVLVVERIVEHLGYRLLVATDGTTGLEMALREKPDLILMDISLPDISCLTVTAQVRADPLMGRVPIIAVTANAMVGDREKCLAAGCNEYLSKPLLMGTLVKALKHFLPEKATS